MKMKVICSFEASVITNKITCKNDPLDNRQMHIVQLAPQAFRPYTHVERPVPHRAFQHGNGIRTFKFDF